MEDTELLRIGTPPGGARKPGTGRRSVLLVGCLAIAALLVGGGLIWLYMLRTGAGGAEALASPTPPKSPLAVAQAKCAPASSHVRVADAGKTLIVQTDGKEQAGVTTEVLVCILTELKVSDAIRSEMSSTRALDGRQVAQWDGYSASWTYHPSNGFKLIVTLS